MRKIMFVFAALLVAAFFTGAASAAIIGGSEGTIIVNSNVEGAQVDLYSISGLIDTKYIQGGSATFLIATTGTPVDRVVVTHEGYFGSACPVEVPAAGQVKSYQVDLQMKPVGGDVGYLQVTSNVVGAKVELYSISGSLYQTDYTNNQGVVTFAVYTTGTPIDHVTVSANGWNTQTAQVTVPAKDQTTSVQVTLTSAVNPTVPVPTPTKSPVVFAIAGLLGVIGAAALLRKE